MDKERSRAAKAHLVAQMQEGQPWRVAKASAGVQTSQSTAYRLLHVVRKQGEAALQDGRHGHPIKLRGAARTFLEDHCRQAPSTPSSVIPTQGGCPQTNLRICASRVRKLISAHLSPGSEPFPELHI